MQPKRYDITPRLRSFNMSGTCSNMKSSVPLKKHDFTQQINGPQKNTKMLLIYVLFQMTKWEFWKTIFFLGGKLQLLFLIHNSTLSTEETKSLRLYALNNVFGVPNQRKL